MLLHGISEKLIYVYKGCSVHDFVIGIIWMEELRVLLILSIQMSLTCFIIRLIQWKKLLVRQEFWINPYGWVGHVSNFIIFGNICAYLLNFRMYKKFVCIRGSIDKYLAYHKNVMVFLNKIYTFRTFKSNN